MKRRKRPVQHLRRLKSGKITVINKGRKSRRKRDDKQFVIASNKIEDLRRNNRRVSSLDIEPVVKRATISRNNIEIEFLNTKFFPKNPR